MIRRHHLIHLPLLLLLISQFSPIQANENPYFKIHVIDEETERGIPLVELKTVNEVRYYTDSNGVVAFNEPGLMGMNVFFHINSHGYQSPVDGFGIKGVRLHVEAGKSAVIKLKRTNIAERLYRITGAGIYRDSYLTNTPIPTKDPLLNGQVMGQDSTVRQIYRGKIYWFWGDTSKPQYPLGNFKTSGATSKLPSKGGLPPQKGIDLEYFVNEQGFCKPICPIKDHGMIWIDGLLTLKGTDGDERLIARYSHMESLGKRLEHGLLLFDDDNREFKHLVTFDNSKNWQCPQGHPIRSTDKEGDYFYFPYPYPLTRVEAKQQAVMDQSQYQAYTCLKEGTRFQGKNSQLVLNQGEPVYSWKANTEPIGPEEERKLIEAGLIQPEHARYQPKDIKTKDAIHMHRGSVHWNAYREKWIMIATQIGGESSNLGEVWYSESDELTGPWKWAQKIITHDQYTFYNPVHHPFFDQENGRIIYFEGTYASTFSGAPFATPRYNYNQIMYRLDLAKISDCQH